MINFALCFAFCCLCLCVSFIICLRAWHLHKVEKIDPINTIKTQKKISALSQIKLQEKMDALLERG